MKVAYFCEPQLGGTYTFFRTLRPALAEHGIDFRCISMMSAGSYRNLTDEGIQYLGVGDLSEEREVVRLASATGQALTSLQKHEFDTVMVLAGGNLFTTNMVAYLPRTIRACVRVPMMTRGAYKPVQTMRKHLNRVFAVSDRIRDDLTLRYKVPSHLVEVIYHGVSVPEEIPAKSSAGHPPAIRLLYAGRIWDADKGVFLLPEILRRLKDLGVNAQLVVAGDGPDRIELIQRFERSGVFDQVQMLGHVPHGDLKSLYRQADVFVFPSRFEGCGFSVLEAMAGGCAPVVSDIRGSLRVIVANGEAGRLATVGDVHQFAKAIYDLSQYGEALSQLQTAAYDRVRSNYSVSKMAKHYADSFKNLLSISDERSAKSEIESYSIPRQLKPTWRRLIPQQLKNKIRMSLERRGLST